MTREAGARRARGPPVGGWSLLAAVALVALLHRAGWTVAAPVFTAFGFPGRRSGGSARAAASGHTGDWGRSATGAELKQDYPTLYVYDHCPFCIRARMIFGLRGLPHKLEVLLNDDVVTPTRMVGKKVLPVLRQPDGEVMGESLDIVAKVDGSEPMLAPSAGRDDIKGWQADNKELIRRLTRPRVAHGLFAEFATKTARQTWIRNHQFPDGLTFEGLMAQTPELVKQLNAELPKLADMLHSHESVNAGGKSYDDITLFPQLRTLTLVKGIEWPEKLRNYVDHISDAADICLLDLMAM